MNDIDYYLPNELIASEPLEERDHSRLLIINRSDNTFKDSIFKDIYQLINPNDCIIFNNTKVFHARLEGVWQEKNKAFDILLIEKVSAGKWKAMVKNSKKLPLGTKLLVGQYYCIVLEAIDDMRILEFEKDLSFSEINQIGLIPLPPYIIKKRKNNSLPLYSNNDAYRYQSLLAEINGSVAAPTASLHFSDSVLTKIKNKNIQTGTITLHVGPGTFKPIDTDIQTFEIHQEELTVPFETIELIRRTKQNNGRVFAVGTTVVRALESMAQFYQTMDQWKEYNGYTKIFIKSPYRFQAVDCLITNFHMPKSTLLLLVQAFGSTDLLKAAYEYAISNSYRFLSYGDAMVII